MKRKYNKWNDRHKLFRFNRTFLRAFIIKAEAATRGLLQEKVFLEISQNSQKNTCARVSFLIKLQAWGLRQATLLKKRL